jgi:hypothetical protein
MKIIMYELITLIKNKKAPKKIKIDEDILNLEIGKETLYRNERNCGWLSFDYYIKNNKLDKKIEILDKNFKLEEIPKISKLYINNELQYNLEEEKETPEKLNLDKEELRGKETPRAIDYLIECKINEVIDYLKNKGDE